MAKDDKGPARRKAEGDPPKTLVAELDEQIMEIRSRLHELLTHSCLVSRNDSNSVLVFIGSDNYWGPLADEAKPLQWQLRRDVRRWFDLVAQLVADHGDGYISQAMEIRGYCEQVIDQREAMDERTPDDVMRRLWHEMDELMVSLKGLYSESTAPTFLPDTNALIRNPALDEWDLSPGTVFELVLTPTLLRELDRLKDGTPGLPRTENAASVVRRLKDYRGRGRLLDGVTLRRDRSRLVARMPEPDMRKSLSWLDPNVEDDRFIASALEVVKARPHAPVAIVTADIHMQTKLELVGLRFIEPSV